MGRLVAAILAGISAGASYGLIALGIVLVYKATRVLNFAQAEIGTIALYVVWELNSIGVPAPIAVLLALAIAGAMGAGLEVLLRPLASAPRLTVTVATLGVGTALGYLELMLFTFNPRSSPDLFSGSAFSLAHVDFKWAHIAALVVTAALGIGLYLFFKRTLFGLGVMAVAQDQKALRLMGVPLNKVSAFTWATGAVLSAIAGIILAQLGPFNPFFMTLVLIPGLTAALVGGLTSLPGAFVGGIAVGIAENIAKFSFGNTPGAEYVAEFALLVVVLLLRPQGLLGAEA